MKKNTRFLLVFSTFLLIMCDINAQIQDQTATCPEPLVCPSATPTSNGVKPTQESFLGGGTACDGGIRFDPVVNGTWEDGCGNTIKLTISDDINCGPTFSWETTGGIVVDKVYVKGGTDQNVYDYTNTNVSSDGGLHSPHNPNSCKWYGLSHIDFCFHIELTISKTAKTSLKRTWDWKIDKECLGDNPITLATGQIFPYPFKWTVSATPTDSDWKVDGTITIKNNTTCAATITNISDVISPDIDAIVNCGVNLPYVLASGATLNCTYSADLPDGTNRINTVTVETSTAIVKGGKATADVDFSSATIEQIDECITVTDDCTTKNEVCVDDLINGLYSSSYSCNISYDKCGDYTYTNKANFKTNDMGKTGSDACDVIVSVPCGGCTLTIGYWKTHSSKGPAPYDPTWGNLEKTLFFSSGKTWYQVLWTPPMGNAYYILAQQYIAAYLNSLNGATTTPAVDACMSSSLTFFTNKTPASKLSKAERDAVLACASTLDKYNNGLIGPGHCSESAPVQSLVINPSNSGQNNKIGKYSEDFNIYPMPASGMVNVALDNYIDQNITIEIYNTTAQLVLRKNIEALSSPVITLDVSNLTTGSYILSVKSESQAPKSRILILQED